MALFAPPHFGARGGRASTLRASTSCLAGLRRLALRHPDDLYETTQSMAQIPRWRSTNLWGKVLAGVFQSIIVLPG